MKTTRKQNVCSTCGHVLCGARQYCPHCHSTHGDMYPTESLITQVALLRGFF